MADSTQLMWSHKRLTELIVKAEDLHEGHWMLAISFGLAPGNFGPNDEAMSPGAVLAITHIGIQRVDPAVSPSGLTVDAAFVNPLPTPKVGKRLRK
jgi:hypothetical protein